MTSIFVHSSESTICLKQTNQIFSNLPWTSVIDELEIFKNNEQMMRVECKNKQIENRENIFISHLVI